MRKVNNPVAKNCPTFNKAYIFEDRKKADKRGKRKHKEKRYGWG